MIKELSGLPAGVIGVRHFPLAQRDEAIAWAAAG